MKKTKNVNMASELDDFDKNLENLKSTVRKSFARVYAALKARELKTLRQLDALRKQCEDNKDLTKHCVQNIHINYENESDLLENVSNYGTIDFKKLNFDSNTFTLEDYVSPNDDHMYSYKTIDELTKDEDNKDIEAIEEAALKEITQTGDCVCYVAIRTEDVSKKFRELDTNTSLVKPPCNNEKETMMEVKSEITTDEKNEENENSDEEVKKIDPTDDWLNSIKGQTETEPSQVTDVMEHSTIKCS